MWENWNFPTHIIINKKFFIFIRDGEIISLIFAMVNLAGFWISIMGNISLACNFLCFCNEEIYISCPSKQLNIIRSDPAPRLYMTYYTWFTDLFVKNLCFKTITYAVIGPQVCHKFISKMQMMALSYNDECKS